MSITTEDLLVETLGVLAEVRDYLDRLPAVPVTRNYVRKLDQFLEAPATRILAQHGGVRRGYLYAPVGKQLIEAKLRQNALTLMTGYDGTGGAITLEPGHSYEITMTPVATLRADVLQSQMAATARDFDPGSGKNWPGVLALR